MRLTLPAVEPGWARIVVDGLHVGEVMAHFYDWEVVLWSAPGCRDVRAGTFRKRSLRAVRAALHARLDADGPWWK